MISAAKHLHKDEGFFEKTFILEIMFEYYFIEKHTICQGPAGKSRLILTVTELRRNFRRSSVSMWGINKKNPCAVYSTGIPVYYRNTSLNS